ncbi:MAG: transcriptional repressor MprA [Amycolatopsis sp.]|jgi:DNA-binding MarR family transcriptional regulator|uniref:MarR family winged helix-turn-helix transcriptional regulator n=1 Tax=Amycolatopsis sp. TaxID=37632 RepID=UPI0026371ED7|nr:MarR family transcriptional regulator [Amycolatopsis sp.]MCU1685273.1 transcriptional repressor MprA [Amycolatopsis sp.]
MKDPRWLDDDEQRIWRDYLAMHVQLTARLNRQLQADSELSLTDFAVLVHLTEAPENRMRAFELARVLEWEKSRLSHHLARMQKRGLVDRTECPSDGRGAFITITPAGRKTIEDAAPKHVETVRQLLFDTLSADQFRTLDTISSQVLARLEE